MRDYKEYWKCTDRDDMMISGRCFTIGKVYERTNGTLVDDDGDTWTKHPSNMGNATFEQVDGLAKQDNVLGNIMLHLSVHVGNNRTLITYGKNNKSNEKVIDREITEDEIASIVEKLTEPKEPKLFNEDTKTNYGVIGTKTNIEDSLGVELFVGDVVRVYYKGEERKLAFVVEESGDFFVMGIRAQTEEVDFGFRFKKVKSYEDLENGEEYSVIKVVK